MPSQPNQYQIKLKTQTITYQHNKNRRNRNIRITIHNQKGLVVSSPYYVNRTQIEKFIIQKQSWILSKLKILQQQNRKHFQFKQNSIITLLGQNYQLQITELPIIKTNITLQNDTLQISVPIKQKKLAAKHFENWIKRYTQKTITNRVEYYAKKHQLKYQRISIKNQQSVWGSCSSKKNLNFSKRLIQLPLWLIDYVICHELAHLTQMNHSVEFWNQVAKYFPEYRKARRHLKAWKPDVLLS